MIPEAERLVRDSFGRVWAPPHDLAAIDELMTEDHRITTAGIAIWHPRGGRLAESWVDRSAREPYCRLT